MRRRLFWAIIDSSVYINQWEGHFGDSTLAAVRQAYIVRQSSVVLSELRRGARTREGQRLVEALFKLAPVQWAPTEADWWEAGRLIRRIGDRQHWDRQKRRAFQNDALIALTARRYGATVVTSDTNDFELLRKELGIAVMTVPGSDAG